ncbi:Casein kinase I gamma [Halotydeus destructor]|nr:Casein kinase I gamma [Halotydeus destructor]
MRKKMKTLPPASPTKSPRSTTTTTTEERLDASGVEGEILGKVYIIGKKLGNGSFGEIRLGRNKVTQEEVAIKLERQDVCGEQLPHEYNLYMSLGQAKGIPMCYFFGKCTQGPFNALAIELLGPSLEQLFDNCRRKFSKKTVLQIGWQLLERFEFLHSKHIIFRDTKPENFLVGLTSKRAQATVHVVDFGLAKKYMHADTGKHIHNKQKRGITGTARYCSVATHEGQEQSRRDDMEALGYLILYFLTGGQLPWQGLKTVDKESRYQQIGKVKKTVPLDELCKEAPEMGQFILAARGLDFEEKPDYPRFYRLLQQIFDRLNITRDNQFDWDDNQALPTEVHEPPSAHHSNISLQKLRSPVSGYLGMVNSPKQQLDTKEAGADNDDDARQRRQ